MVEGIAPTSSSLSEDAVFALEQAFLKVRALGQPALYQAFGTFTASMVANRPLMTSCHLSKPDAAFAMS